MKYATVFVGAVIVILALLYMANRPRGVALDNRGERQWSISRHSEDGYKPVIGSPVDAPSSASSQDEVSTASAQNASGPDASSSDASRNPTAQANHTHMNSQLGQDPSRQPLQDSQTALRSGQSAGQVSNVPGTTSTSPNGTSNTYGTGGAPVFPPKELNEK